MKLNRRNVCECDVYAPSIDGAAAAGQRKGDWLTCGRCESRAALFRIRDEIGKQCNENDNVHLVQKSEFRITSVHS